MQQCIWQENFLENLNICMYAYCSGKPGQSEAIQALQYTKRKHNLCTLKLSELTTRNAYWCQCNVANKRMCLKLGSIDVLKLY